MRETNQKDKDLKKIAFHMVKSPSYQTYHTDGAIGGITPQGKVFVSFYLERGPIPQVIHYELDDHGQLGPEVAAEGKTGIVREMTCGLILDVGTAYQLKEWLEELLKAQDKKK